MITTERLILRPFCKQDYRDYYEYMSRPETYRFERGKPMSLDEAKKFCKEWSKKKEINFWAVTLKDDGKLIGHVSFFPEQPPMARTWQVGYIFNPDYQNKGYASEATRAVVDYAFTECNAHRVVGHCSPDNTASWKVLENCGMKREGLNRKDFPHHTDENGKPVWLDSYIYAIIEDDLNLSK